MKEIIKYYLFLRQFYGWKPARAWVEACEEVELRGGRA